MHLTFVAHARLMFRNEVTRLDAISAIICIESSMTASAILDDAGNALHSSFSDNPDQECNRPSFGFQFPIVLVKFIPKSCHFLVHN